MPWKLQDQQIFVHRPTLTGIPELTLPAGYIGSFNPCSRPEPGNGAGVQLERFHKSCIRFGQPDEVVGSPWKTEILRNGAGTTPSRSLFPIRENRYDIAGNALTGIVGSA